MRPAMHDPVRRRCQVRHPESLRREPVQAQGKGCPMIGRNRKHIAMARISANLSHAGLRQRRQVAREQRHLDRG